MLGIPDIIGCVRGHFIAIELKKSAGEDPSQLQKYVLGKIKKAGGRIYVAHPQNAAEVILELSK